MAVARKGVFRSRLRQERTGQHNEQDNIRDDELAAFKMLAAEMMAYDDDALARAIANGTLMEVMCND